jgi:sialidase-1
MTLRDGRLLALCDVLPVPPDESCDLTNARVVFWWSDDEGSTWSEPVETPIFGIVPDKLVELPSGAWLVATQVHMVGDQFDYEGKLTQIVHRSEDGGKTWQGPIIIGQDDRYNLCEGSILALPDGELVCYMRENSGLGLPAFKAFSNDEGCTWAGVYRTPMDGCHRPVSGLLPSGKVLVTYRYQPGGKRFHLPSADMSKAVSYWARNTFAYLETVESAKSRELSGQGGIIRPIDHDHSPRSDSGYTGWVVLRNSRIFCVNYIVDNAPMAQIRGYWFDESDF